MRSPRQIIGNDLYEQLLFEGYKVVEGTVDALGATERLLVQRQIAGILDDTSVYMGGPSRRSMGLADKIIAALERGERLTMTTCKHDGWMTYKTHGTYCPDCGTDLQKTGGE